MFFFQGGRRTGFDGQTDDGLQGELLGCRLDEQLLLGSGDDVQFVYKHDGDDSNGFVNRCAWNDDTTAFVRSAAASDPATSEPEDWPKVQEPAERFPHQLPVQTEKWQCRRTNRR